jgi:cardiolipin synthase
MLRSRFALVFLVSSLLTITGCSGGNSNTSTTTTPPATAQLSLSVSSLAFNSVNAGQTSAAQTVTLSSTGGLGVTITGFTLSDTTDYAMSNTCTAQLTLTTTCALSVTFKPQTAASLSATISIASNGVGSPQTVTLTGAGTTAPTAAALTLSVTTLAFPSTTVGQTSAARTVTLTNTGGLAASISGITLSDTSNYAMTSTCGASLASTATCTLSVTFRPQTAASLPATISIASNGVGSPQTVTLTGAGANSTSALTYKLYVFPAVFPETNTADASVSALYALINGAQSTVDMTMYELEDTVFSGDLVADCARGVKVRVILSSSETNSNTAAYTQLNGAGANCSAVYSNTAFDNTHQKTITVDNTTTAIMSLNLQTFYYTTTRDFALVENDPADIAAIEATFNADYAAGTPTSGVQGASDFTFQPGGGDASVYPGGDLIWSPTTAQADMLSIINNAKNSLLIENEEMSDTAIVNALQAQCTKGVTVHIGMVNSSDYTTEFTALKAAGCGVNLYPDTAAGLYIHAKAVVADYGLSTQNVYMGSINYTNTSLNYNRELGIFISDPASAATIETTMAADYAGGTPF